METIKRLLFEDPMYLYVALGLTEAVLAIRWRQRGTRRSALALVVPAALALCVLTLDWQVVTDREQIIGASREIARDLQAGSVAAAERYLHEDFSGYYQTKQNVLAQGRRAIEVHKPKLIRLRNLQVSVTGRQAEMSVTTVVEPGAGEFAGQQHPFNWSVRWVKVTAGGQQVWRIRDVTPLSWLGG